jgi:serine/threonine protein kinase
MTTQTQLQEDPQTLRARARVGVVLQEKWKLDKLLGVGGMAAVYSATHRNGKRVAVKMLHAEFSHDEEVRKRFLQEGYAANTISHEGAVSVLDDNVADDGSAFLVMELLEGETLEDRWERSGRRLPVREVLDEAHQVLDVLAAAHAKNVVHRDIKPENLFLTHSGVLKVLDFGIAKVFEHRQARPNATRAGMIMGTPAFMAPEQARARWDEVDGRTDLWAVGATMFTLVSGTYVHEAASSNEQLILSATTHARKVASVAPDVPPAVAAIIDRALAYDRSRRWADARTMQAAVGAALESLGGADLRPSPRRSSGTSTVLGTGASGPPVAHAAAGTMIDSGTASPSAAWAKERENRTTETARLRAAIGDLQQRHAAAKKRVAEAQTKVDAGRGERTQLEQWFKRQVGTRTAAVEDARKVVRWATVKLAQRAIEDRAVFGAEYDATREQIAKLERAAQSAKRDVAVHDEALVAHDARALRTGMVVLGFLAVLALALVVVPIVWRATRVVEPPALPTETAPAR